MATHQHGDWDSLTSVSPSTPLLFGFPLIAEKQLQLFPDIILLVTALVTCKLHDCGCRKKPVLPLDTLRADYPRFFFLPTNVPVFNAVNTRLFDSEKILALHRLESRHLHQSISLWFCFGIILLPLLQPFLELLPKYPNLFLWNILFRKPDYKVTAMRKDHGGNMALLGLSRRRKPGSLLPSTSTSSRKTLLRPTGVNRSGSSISVTGNKELLIHGMGQNVDQIERRAAEVHDGGLSWECKGHYQRAKHVLGFLGGGWEGGLFACLFDWFLWVLIMLATERDSPRVNPLGLSFMNFFKKNGVLLCNPSWT